MPVDAVTYPWPTRFARHYWALLRKNVILHCKNLRSLIVRLSAPFFFMLLLWLVDKAIQADNANLSSFRDLPQPKPDVIDGLQRCESDLYQKRGRQCYDFVYSPLDDPRITAIVDSIKTSNGIGDERIKGFASKDDTDQWLSENTETTNGALHFIASDTDISFVLQTNSSVKYFKGDFQNVNNKFQLPLQLAAHRAILDYQLAQDGGKAVAQGAVSMSEFAHPAESTLSVVPAAGGAFIYAACMFGFIVQLGNMVMERESGLKHSLRTMGMLDSAYYASWATWELLMAFAAGLIVTVSGYIFQFKILLDNNFFVSFLLFFLFQLAMSAVAFACCPLLKKSFQAVYVGFLMFLVGWIMQLVIVFGLPYEPQYENDAFYIVWSLFPWTVFYKGVLDLGEMTSTATLPGISWSRRSSYCQKAKESNFAEGCSSLESICECVMPLGKIYVVLIGLYFLYMVIGIYLDQIVSDGSVANPPWFFLTPKCAP